MESGPRLPRSFYERDTVIVAAELLGCEIVFARDKAVARARIVETEAYVGETDRASHASRGRTARTEVMFGPAGHAYVYLIYGFHNCLNIVTEQNGFPAAVLIRAVEPIEGISGRTDGPGRLCRAFGISREQNRLDMTAPPLFVAPDRGTSAPEVDVGPRVGVGYAGEWATRPWRFWIRGNPHVSRPPRGAIGLGQPRDIPR